MELHLESASAFAEYDSYVIALLYYVLDKIRALQKQLFYSISLYSPVVEEEQKTEFGIS